MAIREAINSLTGMANSAIENGKLSLKIGAEEKKIQEFTLSIGELFLEKLDAGMTFDDEIMALYSSVQSCRSVIDEAKEEISANLIARGFCPECGSPLKEGAKFCSQCGEEIRYPEPAEVPASPACPACGTELGKKDVFCPQCGTRVVPEEVVEAEIVPEEEQIDAPPQESAESPVTSEEE